jgi:fructuronate reductase
VRPPEYRDRLTTGIVHFGPGAFHRAHQADYLDRLSASDPRWGIAAVSLRSQGTIDALGRQDGLYTLAILDKETSFRTIGLHNRFYGPAQLRLLPDLFRNPAVRVISTTVTEKGYCLAPDGTLDFEHPDVRHDLDNPAEPLSLAAWIALALSIRRAEGLPELSVICCDNMVSNGSKLGRAVAEIARRTDPELANWIEGEVRFPNTMVDSITPATDDALRALVSERTGYDDEIPVRREAYTEWVIEDVLPGDAPDLASVGAVITADVAAWEKAKLRILNGSHSTLAYVGSLLGHESVADAMEDEDLSRFVARLVAEDIIPSLEPSTLDLQDYARRTLDRFRNSAIHHKLSQIAWDGSQKLPYRLLDTVSEALHSGRPVERLAVSIAAWIAFLQRKAAAGEEIVDPLAAELRAAAESEDPVGAILAMPQVFPEELSTGSSFGSAVLSAHRTIAIDGARALLRPQRR